MGLDMFLTKETYIYKKDRHSILDNITIPGIDTSRVTRIVEEVAYWRKANAIHNWFVANVQGGVDECQKAYVNACDLEELLEVINTILADRTLAPELLPSTPGFFFGSLEYDEWYWEDIEKTKEVLEKLLNDTDFTNDNWDVSFYYQASW
jgi:hypothetical protein